MPRQSDNILNILTTLPWWVSVITAAMVYAAMAFLLPALAGDNIFATGLSQAASGLAPYAFLLFLLPAPISLLNSWRKRKQLDAQQDIDSIRDLSWQRFEELVGEAYRRQGYAVMENDGAGPDGGIDLVISRGGKRYLVQCKQYRSQKVSVKVVREMFGLVAAEQAAGGIVITSGKFTKDADKFAKDKSLELVDGEQLVALIGAVQTEPKMSPGTVVTSRDEGGSNIVLCPICSSMMVLRTARKGKNAGQQFWGCKGFPKCRGTRVYNG
ncbi:MAG: restriction endonuclease [Proteobacteria bacterium]|nr:restriction endonuclease [Pseudomonadota bacterium]